MNPVAAEEPHVLPVDVVGHDFGGRNSECPLGQIVHDLAIVAGVVGPLPVETRATVLQPGRFTVRQITWVGDNQKHLDERITTQTISHDTLLCDKMSPNPSDPEKKTRKKNLDIVRILLANIVVGSLKLIYDLLKTQKCLFPLQEPPAQGRQER